jgi:hypothetical protein
LPTLFRRRLRGRESFLDTVGIADRTPTSTRTNRTDEECRQYLHTQRCA